MGRALRGYADWLVNKKNLGYNFYFKKFEKMLKSMFIWEGLPDGISEKFIEDVLFHEGFIIFCKTKAGFICARATKIGVNQYEEPIGFRIYTTNGMLNQYISAKDCVVIYNNMEMESEVLSVSFYARRLQEIQKAIDINIQQLANPYIIACSENMKSSVQQLLKKREEGEPFILATNDINGVIANSIQVLPLNVSNESENLERVAKVTENNCLTHHGINNVNILKKERLLHGESTENDEQISYNKQSRFLARQKAFKEINEKFGLDINVKFSIESELLQDEGVGEENVSEQ